MNLKSQTPAALAEEYLIDNIWNNRFPAGSILPSERELAELIGVTRTTLREVLQRLARDGWLTIQHGKSTRVNNVWETSGLNLLETAVRLDSDSQPKLIEGLLSARTGIASIFIRAAFRYSPERSKEILAKACLDAEDKPDSFTELDYHLFRNLAFASGNPIYGLIFNGLRGLYTRVGQLYFSNPEARKLTLNFYRNLANLCHYGLSDQVIDTVCRYGRDSRLIWERMKANLIQTDMLNKNL